MLVAVSGSAAHQSVLVRAVCLEVRRGCRFRSPAGGCCRPVSRCHPSVSGLAEDRPRAERNRQLLRGCSDVQELQYLTRGGKPPDEIPTECGVERKRLAAPAPLAFQRAIETFTAPRGIISQKPVRKTLFEKLTERIIQEVLVFARQRFLTLPGCLELGVYAVDCTYPCWPRFEQRYSAGDGAQRFPARTHARSWRLSGKPRFVSWTQQPTLRAARVASWISC